MPLPAHAVDTLCHGDVEVEGRMPWSSNATFLTTVCHEGQVVQAVYKPLRGERPLWDFPAGLHKREAAAWELSEAMGVGVVPPTVLRDGPFGEGSFQLFVPSDYEQHYFTILEHHPDLHDRLRAICVFDLLANNTDRKGGHCLLSLDGEVWAIDNGLCFAAEPKLRTVIWEFGGEELLPELLAACERLADEVPPSVASLLAPPEVLALQRRASGLVRRPVLPDPRDDYRSYPWPLV